MTSRLWTPGKLGACTSGSTSTVICEHHENHYDPSRALQGSHRQLLQVMTT